MKTIAFAALVLLSAQAVAQAPAGTTEVTADSCKLYLPPADAKGASRIRWSGQCKDGLADGRGIVRIYSGGKISRISETTFAAGKVASAGEAYFIKGGQAVRSRGGDQLEIAASELPTWALELSMLVEDRPVRAAPSRPAPSSTRVAEEKAAADKAKAEAAKAEAEAKKAAAEAKAVADKKAADEKAAAAKAAKEAEAKRVAAQKERAAAQAKALTEKRAAEKAAAEAKAAADAKALTEARAAAERAAAAEKLAQEKAAAEAKAAVEAKAAAEAKTAADAKAAADAKGAAEAKAAADAKAAAEAKAAMDKLAAQRAAQSVGSFVPGRGFGDGGTGEALRGVMTFKLTTDDGRTYGVATFVAGKGEAAIKQNAIALAQVYEKVSPFHAKLLEQPEILTTCGGPGYVVEARLTYPATKTYGWFAGCMGDNIEGTAKAIQQIEDAMHKDFKATPTSFWAYQYLIIGHVDETGIRSRAEYERLARPNLMAPGRVMVLSRPDQWAECTTVANKDPKLKDKVACLKEAMEKLKPSNPLGAR